MTELGLLIEDILTTTWPGVRFFASVGRKKSMRRDIIDITWTDGPTAPMVKHLLRDQPHEIYTCRVYSNRMNTSVKAALVRARPELESAVNVEPGIVYCMTIAAQVEFYKIADRRVIMKEGKIL